MSINNIIKNFSDVINFSSAEKVGVEISQSSKVIQTLAKAIQDHSYIKVKTDSKIAINNQELDIDPESLVAITRIIDKFKMTPEGLSKKLEALYHRACFTADKTLLISIRKDIESLQRDILAHPKLSSLSRSTLQGKAANALVEIDSMMSALALSEILQKGKSMQGYPGEVLSYKDYQLFEQIKQKKEQRGIQSLNYAEKTLFKNKEAFSEVAKAVKSLKSKVREMSASIDQSKLLELTNAIEAGKATKEQVLLVVNCKKLWMDLATEEGSYLQLLDFVGKEPFAGLDAIKQAAFIQGPQVDDALLQLLVKEHFTNKPSDRPTMHVLIEGAGPSGLYAALQLFRNGSNITIVNDRGERVVRNQNIVLDPKWLAQLNFFTGSKYNELFGGPKAYGATNPARGSGTINTKIIEDLLKVRVAELSSYLEDTQSKEKGVFVQMHFESPLRDIRSSSTGFSAVLGQARESADTAKFRKLGIEALTKKILSTKYASQTPDETLGNGKSVLAQAQEEAAAEWERQQRTAKVEKPTVIPFDVLACVGGANDLIRDEFLDPAVPLTSSKNHGIASWLKTEAEQDKRYFSPDNLARLHVRSDAIGYPYLTREHVDASLRRQGIDEVLRTSSAPDAFKEKYHDFTERLLENIGTSRLTYIEPDQQICGFNIRTFENRITVYLGAHTPTFLEEFLNDLTKLIAEAPSPQEGEALRKLKTEIDKRWMNSIAQSLEVDTNVLKMDDEYPINVGTFNVQQKGGDVGAKLLEAPESSAIITAFGDSRVSPHFFTGSGMSTARLGVEEGSEVFGRFNRGEIRSKKDFADQLDRAMDHMKEKTLEKGSRFLKPNDPSERIAARSLTLKNKINEHFRSQQKVVLVSGWKIETEVNEKGEFNLSYIDKNKEKQTIKAQINPEDGRLYALGKKYLVLNDLLVSLGVK